MSWLSEFLHSPIDYIKSDPLKALSLIGAPIAAIAAPFAIPALGTALGVGAGAGAAGAAGAGAAGAGILGAEAPAWFGAGLGGLGAAEGAAGAGLGAGLFGGAEGAGLGSLFGGAESAGLGGLFGGAEGSGLFGSGLFGSAELGAGGGSALGFAAEGAPGVASSLGLEGFAPEAFSSFAAEGGSGGVPFFESNLDWVSRMFPGEFGASPLADSAVPFASAGDAVGALPGISTDVGMAGAPLAGSADAIATGTSGPLAGGTSGAGFWEKLGTGAVNSITKNPIGVGLAGAGLGYNLLQGQKTSPEMEAMGANAAALNAQGQQLMQHLQNGTLPPGLDQAVKNATAAMKARVIANHAKNGQPTNPAQNSALAQELNQVDLNAVALIAQQGQQLLTTGMNATNMSSQLYGMLEGLNRQQDQRTGQAIANFAAALSGGNRGVNINLGGARA